MDYTYGFDYLDKDMLSTLGGVFAVLVLLVLAYYIVLIVAEWKLFKKAGKNGWEAIVPFYSTYVLVEIAGLNWWYFLIAISSSIVGLLGISGLDILCNIATLFVNFLIFYNLALKAGKNGKLYGILGIFFGWILILILGFSKNITIDNNVVVSPNGPLSPVNHNSNSNNNNNNNNEVNYTNTNTNNYTVERYCAKCGYKLTVDTNYCENCGEKIEK